LSWWCEAILNTHKYQISFITEHNRSCAVSLPLNLLFSCYISLIISLHKRSCALCLFLGYLKLLLSFFISHVSLSIYLPTNELDVYLFSSYEVYISPSSKGRKLCTSSQLNLLSLPLHLNFPFYLSLLSQTSILSICISIIHKTSCAV